MRGTWKRTQRGEYVRSESVVYTWQSVRTSKAINLHWNSQSLDLRDKISIVGSSLMLEFSPSTRQTRLEENPIFAEREMTRQSLVRRNLMAAVSDSTRMSLYAWYRATWHNLTTAGRLRFYILEWTLENRYSWRCYRGARIKDHKLKDRVHFLSIWWW